MFFRKRKTLYKAFGLRIDSIDKSFSNGGLKTNFSRLKIFLPEIGVFLFIALAAWTLLQSARLTAIALQIKDRILFSASAGTSNLESAKKFLASQDLRNATLEINSAMENFQKSQVELKSFEKDLLGITRLIPQSRSAENLLSASIDLAEAGQAALNLVELSSRLSFGATGLIRGEVSFRDISMELEKLEKNLIAAGSKIKKSDLSALPPKEQALIRNNYKYIDLALNSCQNLKQLTFLGETLFLEQKRILVIFQNQNELRPTGGFIGSFADILLQDGKIQNINISSIYDLDGQLNENIRPPAPILSVNNRWYFRDANWFTSFDESAKKIISFYEKEGGETPSLLLAITPQVISELLKITGPLKTKDNIELNQDNFLENLQVLTQTDREDPSNEPKKILSLLFTELFQKISQLKPQKKTLIIKSLQQSFSGKQALLYSNNPQAQKIIESFNWGGKIAKSADRDYLLISGANLGGTKTDLDISQSIKLVSTIKPDGKIENHLTINRKNLLPNIPGAHNKTFLRIYVPEKSEFIESRGFDAYFPAKPEQDKIQKNDFEILKWEKSQAQDITSGTLIGKESGKTFFGNWTNLEGGESKTIEIKYALPYRLKNLDRHSLVLQKQPGSLEHSFNYTINYETRNLEWKNFDFEANSGSSLSVKTELNKDLFFGIVLRRND